MSEFYRCDEARRSADCRHVLVSVAKGFPGAGEGPFACVAPSLHPRSGGVRGGFSKTRTVDRRDARLRTPSAGGHGVEVHDVRLCRVVVLMWPPSTLTSPP